MKPTIKEGWVRDGTKTKLVEGKNLHLNHFESVSELQTWLEEYKPMEDKKSFAAKTHSNSSQAEGRGEGWDLNLGWKGALEMSYSGWDEGAEIMRKCMDAIDDELPTASGCGLANGFDWEMSDEGDELSIDSYLEGDDRCWANPVFHQEKPVVRLMINQCASAGISASVFNARGAVICAMVCKLERLGYGVQVYYGDGGQGQKTTSYYFNSVKVKDSDEFLHEGTLAFWLTHPAAFRRIGFRMIESVDYSVCDICTGYGLPANFSSDDFDFVSGSSHLEDASSEGWATDPVAAGKAATAMIKSVIDAQNAKM